MIKNLVDRMNQLIFYHTIIKYQDHQMVNIHTLLHIVQFQTTIYQTQNIKYKYIKLS